MQAISKTPAEPVIGPQADGSPPAPAWRTHVDGLLLPTLTCLIIFVTLVALAFAFWRHELNEVRDNLRSDTKLVTGQVIQRFESALDDRLRPLRRLELLSRTVTSATLSKFQNAAEDQIDSTEWLRLAALVNSNHFCRAAAVRPGMTNPRRTHFDKDPTEFPHFASVLDKAMRSDRESIVTYRDRDGGTAAVLVLPVQGEVGKTSNGGGGAAVLCDIDLDQLLLPMFDGTNQSFAISIEDEGGHPIYRFGEQSASDLAASDFVRVADQRWRLTLMPLESFVARRERRSPVGILLGGSLIAFTLSAGLWQSMAHRRRDRRTAASHLAALTSLNDISLAISANPESAPDVFASLTRAACELLGMSSASINLLDASGQHMHVVHRRNLYIEPERSVYRVEELPMCKQCMENKQLMFAQDVWKNPGPFNPERYKSFGIRSIVVVPFLAQGKPLGAMVLSDARPRRFTSAQRQMAAIWGAQAAVTISNRRLYERMNDAMSAQKHVLDKLKMLYEINTQIQHAETFRESLQMMADLSPKTLDVDCTIICLNDDDCATGFVRVAGATKGSSAEQFVGSQMPCCVHCTEVLTTGKPLVIESASGDPILRETVLAVWGTAVFLPLVTSGSDPFGLVVLTRKASVSLTPEEMQIAQLFATRAAVVIENTRLYEQTRRDADAKAMLLRELNHRVKNNLAAIVGLLSTKPNDLSVSARRWLDRATQRIATMARTHDLFSGGISAVSIQELASKALASVDAIKPPGVRIHTELSNLNVQLNTDRAVTLAMVLYELCCNALVHGMGESGQLTLRGRNVDGDRVAIDVIDSGAETGLLAAGKAIVSDRESTAITQANGASEGIGLSLVQGLVGRELHGRFDLRSNPSGGSIATVEFPVNGDRPPRV